MSVQIGKRRDAHAFISLALAPRRPLRRTPSLSNVRRPSKREREVRSMAVQEPGKVSVSLSSRRRSSDSCERIASLVACSTASAWVMASRRSVRSRSAVVSVEVV